MVRFLSQFVYSAFIFSAALFCSYPALGSAIIGEYLFEDCDEKTPAIYAQHCLEYDITLVGNKKGTIEAHIEVSGHQTSEKFLATTAREPKGLKLIFARYIFTEGTKPYEKGTVLGWLDFDENHNVTLIPNNLTTITSPASLEDTSEQNRPVLAE